MASGEEWILDGNFGGTFATRFERADTIIVLAPSRWRCTLRVVLRTLANWGRAVQADGCPERLEWKFLKWVWRYPTASRPALDAALEPVAASARIVELRSARQVDAFLCSLGEGRRT